LCLRRSAQGARDVFVAFHRPSLSPAGKSSRGEITSSRKERKTVRESLLDVVVLKGPSTKGAGD
jgi:hypothetical protein